MTVSIEVSSYLIDKTELWGEVNRQNKKVFLIQKS